MEGVVWGFLNLCFAPHACPLWDETMKQLCIRAPTNGVRHHDINNTLNNLIQLHSVAASIVHFAPRSPQHLMELSLIVWNLTELFYNLIKINHVTSMEGQETLQ